MSPRRGAKSSEAITEYCSARLLGCSVFMCIRLGRSQHQIDEELRVAAHPLPLAALLLELERTRVGQRAQSIRANQRLVDAAEPAAVRRVDRRAEGDGLAVHRPAGRDDQ